MVSSHIIMAADVQSTKPFSHVSTVEQKLRPIELLWSIGAVRKTAIILVEANHHALSQHAGDGSGRIVALPPRGWSRVDGWL